MHQGRHACFTLQTPGPTFTADCGHTDSVQVYKDSLHTNSKLYVCRTCNVSHIFMPVSIAVFAPFKTVEEAIALQKDMRRCLFGMINRGSTYYRNIPSAHESVMKCSRF